MADESDGWTPKKVEKLIRSLWSGLGLTVGILFACAACIVTDPERDCWRKIGKEPMSLEERYKGRDYLREIPNLPAAP